MSSVVSSFGGKFKKFFTKKNIVILACSVGVIAIGIGVYLALNVFGASDQTHTELLYLEETATNGNIIVGVSESGTASLITTDIEVEYGMTVEEIYVSSGSFVVEGEAMALVNLDDYDADEAAETTLAAAELALLELEIETETKLVQAQSTYDQAIEAGENASTIYNLAIDEVNDGYNDIVENISDLNDEIDDIEDQIANGLTDDQGVSDAEDDVEEAEATIASLTIAIVTAEETVAAETIANETAQTEADAANALIDPEDPTAVMVVAEISTSASEELASLEMQLEQAEANLTVAETALEKAESDYDTAYDMLDEQLEELEDQLDTQKTAKTKYASTMDSDKLKAQETYDLAIATYNNAGTVYDNTITSLEEAIEEAEEYIAELEEADDDDDETLIIDENGYVLAPFTGYVMSVTEIDVDMANVSPLSISLADSSCCELSVSIAQEDISDVEVGMDVDVLFDAYEDYTMDAYVDSIEMTTSSGISASVSYTVVIHCDVPEIEDDTIALFQGMTATVTFILKEVDDVLVISSKCVTTTDGVETVQVLNADETIETREIVTGFSDGFDVEITSGLEEGEIVIIESAVSSNAY
ncbi:MAG: hypothetical protein R3Y35_12300 [Clostridia bacterium]